jgi:hypothetical protein
VDKRGKGLTLADLGSEPDNYLEYLRRLSPGDLEGVVDDLVAGTNGELLASPEATGAMAETNATGWAVDDYEVQAIDLEEGECVVSLTFKATGVQRVELAPCGDRISGEAEAVIDSRGDVTYQNVSAEIEE